MVNQISKSIVGEWELESFVIEDSEKHQRSWGTDVQGLLIYTKSGKVSVSINKQVENESENEFENLFDSILFYSGSYKVIGNQINHQVTQASNPKRIGKELTRFAELDGDRLRLVTPEESFGRAILVWKKVHSK